MNDRSCFEPKPTGSPAVSRGRKASVLDARVSATAITQEELQELSAVEKLARYAAIETFRLLRAYEERVRAGAAIESGPLKWEPASVAARVNRHAQIPGIN